MSRPEGHENLAEGGLSPGRGQHTRSVNDLSGLLQLRSSASRMCVQPRYVTLSACERK